MEPNGRSWRRDDAASPVAGTHWSSFSRIWDRIRPPLRPSALDVACYAWHVAEWARRHGPPRGLILGVTPELYRLPWPGGSAVIAVDRSADMIARVWPGPSTSALRADWTNIPVLPGSIDIALCDGGLVQVSFPQTKAVVRSLRAAVAPGGLCLFRLFVPPASPESPSVVLDDWRSGGVANASLLKLRLGMSLQADEGNGVPLATIWDSFMSAHQADQWAVDAALTADEASTLLAYRGNPARYHFLTLSEVVRLFTRSPGGFSLISADIPDYPLGSRCPIAAFHRD